MHNTHPYQWDDYSTENVPIKVEAKQPELSLLSPPTSPSLHNASPAIARRRSASPRRPRPYPPLVTRFDSRFRAQEDIKMPSSSFNQWSARPQRSQSQGTSSSEGHAYSSSGGYSHASGYTTDLLDRPGSSNSSLSAAWGEPQHQRYSGSPSNALADAISWSTTAHQSQMNMQAMGYTGVAMPQMDTSYDYRNAPGGSSPSSTFTSPAYTDPFRTNAGMYDSLSSTTSTPSSTYSSSPQEELRTLRKRIAELERINERERERVRMLEAGASGSSRSPASGRSPLAGPPVSASFQESWRLRTEARQRQFCSLNRAGNALCAWHDSRRERRVYPPRMAPAGYLNCGCTFEEALFEESLARHGVGSYLPGENVRMDPALRNPLLKVLQERYGYQDGDFERDPRTGDWVAGEGHAFWEHQLQSNANPRRARTESDRR